MTDYNESSTPRELVSLEFGSTLTPGEYVEHLKGKGCTVYHTDQFQGGRTFLRVNNTTTVMVSPEKVELYGAAPCDNWDEAVETMHGYITGPAKVHLQYSDTLRSAWEALEGHAQADELRAVLVQNEDSIDDQHEHDDGTTSNVELAGACYWFSYAWHGGQNCPVYALGYVVGYTPCTCEDGPEPETRAAEILAELEQIMESTK